MNTRNVVIGVVASALVAGVVISCGGGGGGGGDTPAAAPTTFNVSGNLTGASGASTLKLNGGSDVAMPANGAFSFTGVADGTVYNVQIVNANDRCTVGAGAGTIAAANVTGVAVTCVARAAQTFVYSARLSGAQEPAPLASAGSGRGGVVVDPVGKITGGVTVFGITPTAVSLRQAPSGTPGAAGTEIVQLGTAGDGHSFFIPANTTLTGPQGVSLFAGELYFDVFTAAYPTTTGEIRGQINLQGGVLAGVATINFAQETAGGTDAGCTGKTTVGQGTVIVDGATRLITTSYMTHDVTNADLSHIHTSLGPATSGGVIINFVPGPVLAYPSDTTVPLSPTNVSDFLADYLYFNIHSAADGCPSGEIRGNIIHIQGT